MNKSLFFALITGFSIGFIMSDIPFFLMICDNYPFLLYFAPIVTILTGVLTIFYSFKFYDKQDELYQKYHDFTLMAGCVGFFFFGMILQFVSLFSTYSPSFIDYFFCVLLGGVVGQLYFYKKYY